MKKRLSKKEYAEAVANDGRFHPADYSLVPIAYKWKYRTNTELEPLADGFRIKTTTDVVQDERYGLSSRIVDAAKKRGEIILYGTIGMDWFGEGITAKSFEKELKGLGKVNAIDLRINSEGGSVHDARAIYSLLIQHGAKVDVFVDSLAASAASFIAMAGDTITITESAFFMIHNARMFAAGGADDFRAAADFLDTVNRTIADTYTARTGQKADKIKKWMDAETWFTGQQALDEGFATAIVKNKTAEDAKAQITVDPVFNYANVPPVFRPNRAKAMALMQRGNHGTTAV